jgi:very-short-patch-repair endonuclease
MKKRENRWRTNPDLWEKLKPLAREKRQEPTEAENSLWQCLRKNQINGLCFRRQHNIGPFIVDFYCRKAKLVIEVDGPIHQNQQEKDSMKQQYLESLKLRVIRFSNDVVLNNIGEVIKQIKFCLSSSI